MANVVIERGKANTLIMTVSERSILASPNFLIHFISKYNPNEERFINVINISNNLLRYDEFNIIEMDMPNYAQGEVDLYTGQWKYNVYESTSPTLDINDATGRVLETGMVIVIDDKYK